MTEIAAEFERMAAVNPDRGFGGVVIVINERGVVHSQIRKGRVIYGWGIVRPGEDREGIRGSARHICRRVQAKTRRLEVLHRRILRSSMARKVESGVKHEVWRGRIVRIKIQLWGWRRVPSSRGGHTVNSVRRIVLVGILEDAITRQVPFLTNRVIDLDARQVLVLIVGLQIRVVVGQPAGSSPGWSRYVSKHLLGNRIPCAGR